MLIADVLAHHTRRPDSKLITSTCTWRRRTGGQLKTWATTVKADLEPLSRSCVFRTVSLHRIVEPGVLQYVTCSTQLVMPVQPAPGECRHKYKNIITTKALALLNSSRSSYSSIKDISKTLVELWGCRRIAQALVGSTLSGV